MTNGVPTVPGAVVGLVMTGAPGAPAIGMDNVRVPVPPAFVALSVVTKVPANVGVPLMMPLAELIVRPVGIPVAPKLAGEFVARIVKLNALPTVPAAEKGLFVTTGAGGSEAVFTVRTADWLVAGAPTAIPFVTSVPLSTTTV